MGKSDLALRALAHGFRLVADDRVCVWLSAGRPFGRAPEALRGLAEVRGLGVRPVAVLAFAQIRAVVDLREGGERVPKAEAVEIAGAPVPRFDLAPFGESAPGRLAAILGSI